jgi:hypothetical protein
MFIIEVKGERYIWENKKEDDFLQFLPKHFDCLPEEISVHALADADIKEMKKEDPADVTREFAAGGKIKKVKITPPSLKEGEDDPEKPGTPVKASDPRTRERRTTLKVVSGQKLKKWPYDEKGEFLGHEFEEVSG